MKEIKLLDRVQAVSHSSINIILATVREYGLKSELTCNTTQHISLQFNINEFMKSVIINPLSCKNCDH